ncbi:MAG: glycosyltransferase family 4 protein [Deltaproteobacteria bacterium]|nr:glycosyltransferase family 4 protein [Deltaproteobacteria bacterium]
MARPLLILNERDQRHPAAGGAELHVSETARYFAELGYAPTLLCSRFRGAPAEEMQDGLRVRRFGNRLTYYLMLPSVVRRALAERPGTVIVEHLCKLPFCTPLYVRAPLVLLTHHLFGVTAFQQVPFPVACAVYVSEKFIPWVYRGRRFVAVSPSTRDDLIGRGIPERNITVIPNGLDHSLYHARGRVSGERPTILVLGRVEFYKRIELILQAAKQIMAQIPDLQVVVVGDGGARSMLEGLSRELGLGDHVHFSGFVSNAEKVDYIRRSHVLANASEKEGWGLTVLEANACGVPAVASDVPGLRDAVRDGETGVLVAHGDVNALAAALRRILVDAAYRERLAAGALAWAQRFDWRTAAYDILAVIEAVGSAATERALQPSTSDSMGGVA